MEKANQDQEECLLSFAEKLCLNENYADVIFIVEQERVPAHRNILATCSEYFRALLYENFAKSVKTEFELDANLEAFKFLLKYIYTGCSDLSDLEIDFIIKILKVANEYGFTTLVTQIADNLITILNPENLVIIMNNAHLYNLQDVYNRAVKHVEDHTTLVIQSKSFNLLSMEVLYDIIGRDSFSVYELDIFKAVIKWGEKQTAEDLQFVLSNVRFTLMQIGELRDVVAPTGVLKPEEIDKIIEDIKTVEILPFRHGETHRNQLTCITNASETEFGLKFTNCCNNRIFKLPTEKWVNHIFIRFESEFGFGYYLEVSPDKREWTRVVDFSKYPCHQDQTLYFDARMVRYVYLKTLPTCHSTPTIKDIQIDIDYYKFPPLIKNGVPALTYLHETKCKFIDVTENNCVSFWFCQPQYINCMTFENKFVGSEMLILKTSIDGDNFEEIEYELDPSKKCYFFNPHIGHKVNIYFKQQHTEVFDNKSFRFFFNPAKPSSIGIRQ